MIHSAVFTWVRRGVGGDQGPVQVQGGEQLGQGRDLIGLVGHPPLCHDDSADLVQGRQQVRGRVVRGAGPAHGLTRPPRSPCGRRWRRCACRAMRSGGRRGPRGPGPARPCGWWTCDGGARPASRPEERRSSASRSVACSQIAIRLPQPARIPVTARHRIVGRS